MADKKSCLWYEKATASIYFPEGHVCCDLCACMETSKEAIGSSATRNSGSIHKDLAIATR